MKRRFRLWVLLVSTTSVFSLVLFLTRDPKEKLTRDLKEKLTPDLKEKCHHYVSHREVFRNCSGCFPTEHIPVLISQPQICATSANQIIDVIFVVFTRVDDVERRNLIRRTWASVSKNNTSNFRHAFMLGTSPNFGLMIAIEKETRLHRDVVVTEFRDSYLNLTLKTLTTLHWLSRYCGHARFFQKVDDDVWVNTRGLMPALAKHSTALHTGLGGSQTKPTEEVQRIPGTKWYASCKAYPDKKYPTYIHGVTYVGSLHVARRLSTGCKDVPFFHMEDVFLGLCQEVLGLTVVNITEMRRPVMRICEGKNDTVAAVYPVSSDLFLKYWRTEPCKLEAQNL